MPFNHLILCCPLLFLPSIFLSMSLFQWVSSSNQVAKALNFSFSFSPSSEYPGLSSLRINSFDLFAFQGILKSLLQHHILKASILQCTAFFMVQLLHLYMTTRKTRALTIRTLALTASYCLCPNVVISIFLCLVNCSQWIVYNKIMGYDFLVYITKDCSSSLIHTGLSLCKEPEEIWLLSLALR